MDALKPVVGHVGADPTASGGGGKNGMPVVTAARRITTMASTSPPLGWTAPAPASRSGVSSSSSLHPAANGATDSLDLFSVRTAALKRAIPSQSNDEKLKAEFQAEGHASRAMLKWVGDISRLQLEAFVDADKAGELFEVLRDCALDASKATPYRALCVANAKRLTGAFPERLSDEFSAAEKELPETLRRFLAQIVAPAKP